jgi:hypothetical protein
MSTLLCAAAPGYYGVLLWGSTGVVMVLLLGFGLLWFRKKYHPDSLSDDNKTSTFSMQSIEEMRAGGIISDDEFRRLRASSLGLDAPMADNSNSTLSTPADVDDGTEELDSSNEPQDHKESK